MGESEPDCTTPNDGNSPSPPGEGQPHDQPAAPPPAGRTVRSAAVLAGSVLTNLRSGIRLAFLGRAGVGSLSSSPDELAFLALFDLLLHLLLDLARVGPNGYFTADALPYGIVHIPLMLLTGLCTARLVRRDELALVLPAAYLAIGIPLDLAAALGSAAVDYGWLDVGGSSFRNDHFYPFFVWWGVAALVATLRLAGPAGIRRIVAAVPLALFLVLPLWYMPRGGVWVENYADGGSGESRAVTSEEFLYEEPLILEDTLAGVRPSRKGIGELYFVGFAGYGSQDVFLRELESVGQLFRERFDAAGRSVMLVNNPATLRKYPIATATSLELALKRVGEMMDRERDILVLYLTSHGSEEHRLAADLWPLELKEIDPVMVRKMLDAAGIRWRVVVVSACYSGGFIDPLKDDGTLIMTASDASHNSFGCSNSEDFTWFGRALFDELRRTHSFTTAFGRAAESIRRRESAEREPASNPQIYVGDAIRAPLARLEVRLAEKERREREKNERSTVARGRGEVRTREVSLFPVQ